ncbi:MAG: flavodoxin [Oscillospiraceae bacterium]
MKRIFALILALCMTFSLFACGKKQADPTPGSQSSANTGTVDPGQGGGSAAPTDPGTGGSGSGSGSGDPSGTGSTGTGSTGSGWAGTRVAVIYFSCTGNTRTAAERIRDLTGADLMELVPEQPYTSQDLDYNDESCRANQEQKDPAARPRIAGQPLDLSQYGTIYLGYPIWQGTAPRIINTFLDSYDLTGKTIRPFCTSGSSGIETSVADIRAAAPGVDVTAGLRIADPDGSDVKAWALG